MLKALEVGKADLHSGVQVLRSRVIAKLRYVSETFLLPRNFKLRIFIFVMKCAVHVGVVKYSLCIILTSKVLEAYYD